MKKDISKIDTSKIKAFFFDNDSTLFNHSEFGKPILDSTYESLRKLRENNYKVCMITSRSYEEMYNVPSDFLDLFDDVCLLSGAYIISRNKEIKVTPINKESTTKLINLLDNMDVTYRYATSDGKGYLNRHDADKEGIFKFLYDMVPEIKKYEQEDVLHFIVYVDKETGNKIFEKIQNVEYSYPSICSEFSEKGVDKGLTLKKMCEKYGIGLDQSCAFGDSGNDISMFDKAELSICLGNGKKEVKEKADYITDNIWEDGVYNALKHFKFIK